MIVVDANTGVHFYGTTAQLLGESVYAVAKLCELVEQKYSFGNEMWRGICEYMRGNSFDKVIRDTVIKKDDKEQEESK